MHRITVIATFASLLLLQSSRAQDRPILNPAELIGFEPKPTEFACIEHWDLPQPLGPINWRDFPPQGLLEIRPEPTGFPLSNGVVAGPQLFSYDEDGRLASWTSATGNFGNPAETQIRMSYAYDDSGRLVEVLQEVWRDGGWGNGSRSSYSYLDAGQVSHLAYSVWFASDWDLRRTVDCQYDDAGRLTKRLGETCPVSGVDPNPACEPSDSTAFFYDDLGRILGADRFTQVFRQGSRRVRTRFEYDVAGRLIEAVNPRNDPFIDDERFEYHYDESGRLSSQEIFRDFKKKRIRYSYQHRGLLTRIADDSWLVGPDGYIEEGETRYEYDAAGRLETVFRYPSDPEFWSRSRYRYDDEKRIVGETRSSWTGTDWGPEFDSAYEFDASGLLRSYTEVWDSDSRQGEFRFVYSYAVGTATSEDLPAASSIRLEQNYPNPVTTRTTIVYTLSRAAAVRLTVFDALGRSVRKLDEGHHLPGLRSIELDASDLSPGVYLYRLEANGTIRTGTMVVADQVY